ENAAGGFFQHSHMRPWTRTYLALHNAVGDWRIFYSIDREDHVVDLYRIGTRGELYRSRSVQKQS
ncbi:MAG: type II toxin-antitoxin system RelE/ParE family toxin, partial [Candidatus Binatia bacterium]